MEQDTAVPLNVIEELPACAIGNGALCVGPGSAAIGDNAVALGRNSIALHCPCGLEITGRAPEGQAVETVKAFFLAHLDTDCPHAEEFAARPPIAEWLNSSDAAG